MMLIERAASTLNFFPDIRSACHSDERLGIVVMVVDVGFDGCCEFLAITKNAAAKEIATRRTFAPRNQSALLPHAWFAA